MALYAFDGTWNEDEPGTVKDTNVVKFRDAYLGEHKEYLEGVGSRGGRIGRFLGGLFGAGGRTRIAEMYDKLVANWQTGDHDIDIVGFSRGGALAVHFSNVVAKRGIRTDDNTLIATPDVRFLGVWDVVASFGIPINAIVDFQEINIGWDLKIPAGVQNCCHALALDERRQTFVPTRLDAHQNLDNVDEVWFRGVHSDVGG